MIDKIFRIVLICIGIFWLGFFIYVVVNGPFENNSQETVGIPITITTSSNTYYFSIPEYNKKLDYLWSKLSEKERCRFEYENGLWRDNVYVFRNFVEIKGNATSGVVQVGTEIEVRLEQCKKWLEKTESKYLIP